MTEKTWARIEDILVGIEEITADIRALGKQGTDRDPLDIVKRIERQLKMVRKNARHA
jgi:hypothetical protein